MREFFRNNILILVLLNSANLFNYLFQLVVGRSLSPEDFGSFNALNSMAVILSAPAAVLPIVFSRATVKLAITSLEKIKSLLINGLRLMMLFATGFLFLGILAIPWLKDYLHLSSSSPLLIMLTLLALSLIFPLLLGVLQGLHRYTAFGVSVSGATLVRLFSGVLLVFTLGWGVNGALLSGIMGVSAAIGFSLWVMKDLLKGPMEPLPDNLFPEMWRFALPVFLSTTMVMALGNLDIILVKHYCTPEEAGLYATAAILGRIALFLPGVLITVLFPEAAKAQETGEKDGHMLGISLGLTALLGGGFALVCNIWPAHIISILFGSKYELAAPLLQTISLAMALLAVANVVFTYSLARSKFNFLWPLVAGVGMMLCLVFNFHDSALTIAKIVLYSVEVILAGTLAWYFFRIKQPVTSP